MRLYVGGLPYQTTEQDLIDLFAEISGEWPKARLVLVGDGPSRSSLQQAAAALNVLDRVHFAGELVTPVNLHQFFDVSVLCSLSEGFPNSIIEAMAASRPVIATPVGGVLDVVEEGVTGLLRPSDDPAPMAEAIIRLRADPAFCRRLGEAGRSFVSSRYGQDQVMGMLMATYRSMSRGRAHVKI